MLYNKRWVITGLFISIVGVIVYFYDIYPMLVQLAKLNQSEKNITEELLMAKTPAPEIHSELLNKLLPDNKKLNDISELISSIYSSGLTIQTISLSSRQSNSTENNLIHFVLGGDYQQLSLLLYGLKQHINSVALQNFSYKWTEKNNLLITIDILFFGDMQNIQITNHNAMNSHHSPFCTPGNINKWADQNDLNVALSAPLDRIKMAGYLQLGKHRQALVLLPNTIMRTVEPGFLLGSERGMVIAVHHDHTLVRLPDGRNITLALTPQQR